MKRFSIFLVQSYKLLEHSVYTLQYKGSCIHVISNIYRYEKLNDQIDVDIKRIDVSKSL